MPGLRRISIAVVLVAAVALPGWGQALSVGRTEGGARRMSVTRVRQTGLEARLERARAGERVSFLDGARVLATVPVDARGRAVLTRLPVSAGAHAIRAVVWGRGAEAARAVRMPVGSAGGGYEPAVVVEAGATAVAAGDFNGDGLEDLAAGGAGGVSVYLAQGRGGFGAPMALAGGGVPAAGDWDGDGRMDLAVAGAERVRVWLGDGRGGFVEAAAVAVAGGARQVVAADLNGDGMPDLAVLGGERVTVLAGLGDGGFAVSAVLALAGAGRALAAGDLDGDGLVDVAVAEGAGVRVFPGVRAGAWGEGSVVENWQGAAAGLRAVAGLGLAVRRADGTVLLLAARQTGGFHDAVVVPGLWADGPDAVEADVNGDRVPDRLAVRAAGVVSEVRTAYLSSLVKTHQEPAYAGQKGLVFEVVVHAGGGDGSLDEPAEIVDVLPPGLTLVSAMGGGWECFDPEQEGDPQKVHCLGYAAVENGVLPPLRITVDVAPDAPEVMVNTAQEGGHGTDAPYSSDAVALVHDLTDIAVEKTHSEGFQPGDLGRHYRIVVRNLGDRPSSGMVTVTDTLPAGLTLVSMDGPGWSCTAATATCTRSDALGGASAYPAITVTVDVALDADYVVVNSATVTGGGDMVPGNNTSDDATPVQPIVADLVVTKTHAGSFLNGQGGWTYTITVSNVGLGPTVGAVTVVDTLPAGMTATAMAGAGWACTVATATCTRADEILTGQAYPPITLTVSTAADMIGTYYNQVAVSGGGDGDPGNSTASDQTVVGPFPDVTVAMTHNGDFHQAQQGAQYTVTVTNSGHAPTSGLVTLSISLDTTAFANGVAAGSGWLCTGVGSITCTRTDALAEGQSYPAVTVTTDVLDTAPAAVSGFATVRGGADSDPQNNYAEDPTVVAAGPKADLTLTKTHLGDFTQGQQNAGYTITVTNAGAAATKGAVTVTEYPNPLAMQVVLMSGNGWNCQLLPEASCTRSDALGVGQSYSQITVTVNVLADAPASAVNGARVVGGGETNLDNDYAEDPTTIAPASLADLTIAKSHQGDFQQGQQGAHYALVVTNAGSAASTGLVTVTEQPPAGLQVTSMSGVGWTCQSGVCSRSDALAGGQSYAVIDVLVDVAADAASGLTNRAVVSGGGDDTPGNNTAEDYTLVTVLTTPDLTVAKSHSGDFTQNQAGAQYTIVVSNVGNGTTSGLVTVTEQPPAGALTNLVLSGVGWWCAGLSCTRSDGLGAGQSYPAITVTASVTNGAAGVVVNQVTVSGGGETNTGNDQASDATTIVAAPADLVINKTHLGAFTQGQTGAQFVITVSNQGGGATAGPVTVTDAMPAGLTATGLSGVGWACAGLQCTRSDALGAGQSYPVITVTVDVAADAAAQVVNTATVSGGGDSNAGNNVSADGVTVVQTSLNVTVAPGAAVYSRATQRWSQQVQITNHGAAALSGAALVLDALAAGVSLYLPDGVTSAALPAGSPYRELAAIGPGATLTVMLEFTRTGAAAVSYTPRVIPAGVR